MKYFYNGEELSKHSKQAKQAMINKDGKVFSGFILVSSTGEQYQNIVLAKFAEEHGLLVKRLRSLINGKQQTYKGWKILPLK